ncbi:flavodoxin family protein [Lacticaseibacillus saniviri]|uniref:Flavodoxin n=3 Tax=Lacticaseibacillus saniviri TaxID=931533 RepID=A0A0R2MXP5_9LACO|nr:flavodoxin [Lacticaseibacillus saniviri]KRO18430.1 flavodoxin [Lacticaseibacillus saniviri JCM 17471 = DSM 24301]
MSKTSKWIAGIIVVILLAVIGGALFVHFRTADSTNTPKPSNVQKRGQRMKAPKTLIVYYSRTGNTKAVAELIQQEVGGDLAQIETKTSRPSNYRAEVEQNAREQEQSVKPALKSNLPDLKQYDRIFIGSPTWNMALPQAVVSFMANNDFAGKTVIPFNTNGGYGVGSVFTQIKQGTSGARVLKGFSIKGGEEINGILLAIKGNRRVTVSKEIRTWLTSINQQQ